MNKMTKVYIIWGVIVVFIFVLLTIFGFIYKNKSAIYKDLENRLVDAEKKYVDAKFLYPNNGEPLKISAEEMMDNGYLESMEIDDETCDGYAVIQKNGTVYEYKGFIKCNSYTTKGYEK